MERTEEKMQYGSYVDYVLAKCCIPVLLRKKPSSMVTLRKADIEVQEGFYTQLQEKLLPSGAAYCILFDEQNKVYLFIYQRRLIQAFYCGHQHHELLDGYQCGGDRFCLEQFLRVLKKRFTDYKLSRTGFPHEIGIFFGYPLKDVEKYIACEGKNYLCCGYWKVYDNMERAVRRFKLYDAYKTAALRMCRDGMELEKIVSCLI